MTKDQPSSLIKAVLGFLSGTLLSRISGFFRDISMAFCFGATSSIAAFLVALRFAILLRRIFGEGALLNGFIPHFESSRKEDQKSGAQFFRDIFFSSAFVLTLIICIAEILIYYWLPVASIDEQNKQIFRLTALILPGVLFICLFGICSGLLHCEKHFFLTGAAPIAYNMIWIGGVWFLRNESPENASIGLSLFISLAFFFQWLITMPKTIAFLKQHLSWREIFRFRLFSSDLRKMASSLSLGVLGVAAAQINSAIDTIFSRYSALEGPAYLNYAIHLQQLPLALFGVGVASALLPPLTRALQSGELERAKELFAFAITNTLLFILPCTAAIFALGSASVSLIYGRGAFDDLAMYHTIRCLWGYGLGLVPMVLTLLFAQIFYAKRDYITPTVISLISIAMNFSLNILFVYVLKFGPESLGYSTSLASIYNAFALYKKIKISFSRSLFLSILKTMICSAFAGIFVIWVGFIFLSDPTISILFGHREKWTRIFGEQCSHFFLLLGIFVSTLFVTGFALKRNELLSFMKRKQFEGSNK